MIVQNNDRGDSDEHEAQIYEDVQMTGDRENDDMFIHPPGARSAYFKGRTYQERTLLEEARWKAIMPALFKAFMTCSFKSRQWGDENSWDNDHNTLCNCPQWKKSTVEVDVVDITSTYSFLHPSYIYLFLIY